MAVSMAEDPTKRKACDDCHRQKLKCDRNGKPPCSRCHVKNIECNTSTSRRFKKHLAQTSRNRHQHHSKAHHHHPRKPPASPKDNDRGRRPPESHRAETALAVFRSPKRRRTERELDLVQLDTVPQANDLAMGTGTAEASASAAAAAAKSDDSVASHTLLEMPDLDFNIDSLDFYSVPQTDPQDQDLHLSLSQPPESLFQLSSSHSFPVVDSWDLHGHHHQPQHHLHHHHHQQHQHQQRQSPPTPQQPQTQTQTQTLQHAGLPHLLQPPQTLHSGAVYRSVTPGAVAPIAQHHLDAGGSSSGGGGASQHPRLGQPPKSRRSSNAAACGSGSGSVLPAKRLKHRRNKPLPGRITLRDRTAASSSATQKALPLPPDWMAQITELHNQLLSLSSALHKQPRDGPHNAAAMNGPVAEMAFPMEDLFQLSRVVAETLNSVCMADPDSSIAAVNGSSDPASCMMVLSVYIRLLDIYQKVFNQVKREVSHRDGNGVFMSWKLPDVSVGSFAVDSSPFFQMSLAVQVAEDFLNKLSKLTAALDPALRQDTDKESSAFVDVAGVSYRALKAKEEDLGKELDDLRNELEAVLD